MKRRKIKKRYHKSKNALVIVALGITATIITLLFSSFFVLTSAKEKITITEFKVPTDYKHTNTGPYFIASGIDGNLWYTKYYVNKIGQITPIGTLCPGKERCFLPVPFDGQHTIEGMSFDPNPNGETVLLPYPLCEQRKNISCQFNVDFQQYKGLKGTSSNIAIP